ncbi:hypothetical protein ROHU_015210 [Labeo rohita]|uniref:Uncharacterized protein n=1 Tax=Labeo rohita TaxID=84645 RepID=A0A498NPI4_LABRO|nr:hypothetical protein ROHU_015210 [Labeo rohita]
MVKKCAIPDKQLWAKYAIRIFSDTDSYDLARLRARKAQETSHVEDSDGNGGRKVIPLIRFREEEVQPSQPRWAKQSQRFPFALISHSNSNQSTSTNQHVQVPPPSTFQPNPDQSSSTKQHFQGACSKVYTQHKSQQVEEMIAVTLKHAPHHEKAKTNAQHVSERDYEIDRKRPRPLEMNITGFHVPSDCFDTPQAKGGGICSDTSLLAFFYRNYILK